MRTLKKFYASLNNDCPDKDINVQLRSLWYDAKGDWQLAHQQVDHLSDPGSAWVHAYLHRKEGDTGNADYWYRRAGQIGPDTSLQQEWERLVQHFLNE